MYLAIKVLPFYYLVVKFPFLKKKVNCNFQYAFSDTLNEPPLRLHGYST